MTLYQGKCFCGAVEFTVTGEPEAMGYCHCESCRHWSAAPVNAFVLWKPEALKVPSPVEYVGFDIPNEFVVGYGLDYDERYRNLPYIAILREG